MELIDSKESNNNNVHQHKIHKRNNINTVIFKNNCSSITNYNINVI